jgi:hypothetical protein
VNTVLGGLQILGHNPLAQVMNEGGVSTSAIVEVLILQVSGLAMISKSFINWQWKANDDGE